MAKKLQNSKNSELRARDPSGIQWDEFGVWGTNHVSHMYVLYRQVQCIKYTSNLYSVVCVCVSVSVCVSVCVCVCMCVCVCVCVCMCVRVYRVCV